MRTQTPLGHSPVRCEILCGVLALLFCASLFVGCDQQPAADPPPEPAASPPPPAESAAANPIKSLPPGPAEEDPLGLSPEMVAYAAEPAGIATGLFIDRLEPSDLRLLNYNVNWDHIFPRVDVEAAARFQRMIKALDPDIIHLQEIRKFSAEDAASLLNQTAPLDSGRIWYAFKGGGNVILSKYPLSNTAEHTQPRGQREFALALVDLPDDRYPADVYVINNHWKCCGGHDPKRQQQADALVAWIRDARTPGDVIDLPANTGFIISGDFNLVESEQPLMTLLTGDIYDETRYGPDTPPDWDGTELVDAHPLHNLAGPDDYTWRNDTGKYDPGRLDFVIYSDSVLQAVHSFVLNTVEMSTDDLESTRLQKMDVTLDGAGERYDHLPLVVDFRPVTPR